MISRPKLSFLTITATLGLSLTGYVIYTKTKRPVQAYSEHTITRGTLEISVQATGTVQPENRLVVKPQIAGRVDEILIQEGQPVKGGQVLAWMSSNDRAALMDMAKSAGEDEQKRWRDLYKPSPIIAPLGGIVIGKQVERGQTVSTGDTVFIISDRLIVLAQVDETDLSKIVLGQTAEIRVDAYSDKPIQGKVIRIAYESKQVNNVTIYEIRILPNEVPNFMRSGMTASVKFLQKKIDQALLLPVSMIPMPDNPESKSVENPSRTPEHVTVLLKSPRPAEPPSQRSVALGATNGKFYEIKDGLSEGDVVLRADQSGDSDKKSTNPFSPFGAPRSGRR